MNPSTTPEIQQKLLALQRHHQQQMQKQSTQPTEIKPAPSTSAVNHSPVVIPAAKPNVIGDKNYSKVKTVMTPEMREDCQRYINQTL